MGLNFQGGAAKALIERRIGSVLIEAAKSVQIGLMKALEKNSYPPASKVGEFPHWRTGNLVNSVMYDPTDPATVGRERRIRIGYSIAAPYGAILEAVMGRLGLNEMTRQQKGQIDKWLAAAERHWARYEEWLENAPKILGQPESSNGAIRRG